MIKNKQKHTYGMLITYVQCIYSVGHIYSFFQEIIKISIIPAILQFLTDFHWDIRIKKTENFNPANSQYFFVKILWIGPWVIRID